MKRLLSGNEAVAYGAWAAGVQVAAGYPGTPSTEILETFAPLPDVYAEWSTNEKVALDVAIGAAYAGRRAVATMKHVGLNVAADSFFYVSFTGIEAGLLIVVADDPALHSSQNEQDTRRYAKFARVPCLDPADSQEAHDMAIAGLELSEQFDTPVLLRLTTRVSHSSTVVEIGTRNQVFDKNLVSEKKYPRNPAKYVMVPAHAAQRHPLVEERTQRIAEWAETSPLNRVEMGDRVLGIVTCGVAYQYAREVFPDASFLKLGMTFPLPRRLIRDFAAQVEQLIVIEELDPCLEEEIKLMGIACEGKSCESKRIFPLCLEFSPHVVRESAIQAGLLPPDESRPVVSVEKPPLPPRPPILCPGCPHRPVFVALRKLKLPVNGDIGCYTLGLLPPLNALHTCGCMGAGIGVAHGAAVSTGSSLVSTGSTNDAERHVAVIGDSTFFHTGMPALLNVAYNRSNVIVNIMDNRITAMTGHQDNPGTGKTLQGIGTPDIEFEPLVRAMGIEHVTTVDSYRYAEVEAAFKAALERDEPSVIVTRRECALLPQARRNYLPLRVDTSKCVACYTCLRTGCPALRKSTTEVYEKTGKPQSDIDPLLCTGCELCAQVCPTGAILFRAQITAEKEGE
ncbi:MAG: indolepyruvate ferredoxin oxidoreductase subunit alpha [Anaerolineae bacterium]|nr:indolepyruvate ferredoxin oxidoreductase subunit alpha [Anaerolineae bacterium]